MTVTAVEPLDKRRSRVTLEGEQAFVLYRGEIRRYHIEAGGDLPEQTYREIVEDVLRKRARERSLYLLKSSPKTEAEIRRKLREGGYPEEVIGDALSFLRRYHYVDDEAYVRNYLEVNRMRRSRTEMAERLAAKGIPRELVSGILEEEPCGSGEAIAALLRKRRVTPDLADEGIRRRTVNYLMRRGFRYAEIREAAPWLFGGPDTPDAGLE